MMQNGRIRDVVARGVRKKKEKNGRWLSGPIYKETETGRRERRGGQMIVIKLIRRRDFREDIKIKIC